MWYDRRRIGGQARPAAGGGATGGPRPACRAADPHRRCRWQVMDSNHRRLSRRFYRPLPLAARATCRAAARASYAPRAPMWRIPPEADRQPRRTYAVADPSFDVVSKVDRQEVDNALNQAAKEIATRYDFKGVGASVA